MGEKDKTKNEGAQKAAADGGEKAAGGVEMKEEGPVTAVLKLDLHCEGCAKKVRRSVSHLKGVEKVKADWTAKKLTVTGKVDPTWLRENVEIKTKKKVELISPPPKTAAAAAAAGGDKKAEEKSEKKAEEEKSEKKAEEEKPEKKTKENKPDEIRKPKEAIVAINTVVMKTKLHCDGCATKIKRIISKNFEGVESITTDLDKDSITVTGTMNVDDLNSYLKEKLKRVEILPSKKEKEIDGGKKKEKIAATNGDKKAEEKSNGGGEETKIGVSKMEHHGYNAQTHYAVPMGMYGQSSGHHDQYGAPMYHHHGYSGTGHMVQYTAGPPPPPPTYVNMDDQMFSDENPNGCFVM